VNVLKGNLPAALTKKFTQASANGYRNYELLAYGGVEEAKKASIALMMVGLL
jgi:hypothetical protein